MSETMQTPLVSVLMTAWNRGAYIADAIASVLAQTFTDFELVIVDDASTDRTAEIAREWAGRDPRVRVVVNERNLGDYPNRNHAATLARGTFLKYHDSDDIMYSHCLEVMVRSLIAEPRAGFALTSRGGWTGDAAPMLLTPRLCYEREFLGHGMFFCGPACALFRTDTFHELGGWPERGVASDHLFWLHACARTSVLLVPGDLFWYRSHEQQEMKCPDASRAYAEVSAAVWQALSADACPLDQCARAIARRNWAYVVARGALRQVKSGQVRNAWERLAASGLALDEWIRYLRPPSRNPAAGVPLAAVDEVVAESR